MAKRNFPELGRKVRTQSLMGVEHFGTVAYYLSSQWVLRTPVGRQLVIHPNDHWEYRT